jgi:hypothetical protein
MDPAAQGFYEEKKSQHRVCFCDSLCFGSDIT